MNETRTDPPNDSLDAWEQLMVPLTLPHAKALICKDGTVVTFIGPRAYVLAAMFQGAIKGEGLL